jgi:hypothetical protein
VRVVLGTDFVRDCDVLRKAKEDTAAVAQAS